MKQTTGEVTAAGSARYRYFIWMAAFFAVCNLLVANDYATIWPGGEAWMLWRATGGEAGAYLPALLYKALPAGELWLFWPRLVGVLLALAGAWAFYRWSAPVLGGSTTQLTLLAIAGSLFVPSLAKQASADIWALCAHLVMWLGMLRTLKQPMAKWRWISYIGAIVGAWVSPVSTAIFALALILLLFWRHPQGGALLQRNLLAPLAAAASAAFYFIALGKDFVLPLNWAPYWSDFWRFVISSLLGFLPVIGFLAGGIRDLVFKFRKEEELALVLVFSLIASLLAQSLMFPILLAILVGKQMQLYFAGNYPWRDWVRGPAIVHMIAVCIGLFLALLGGFVQLQGAGFRAVMACGAAYWAFSFLAVIGLYGLRRDLALGGSVLAGVLATLFFWLQLYPYLEATRNWPQRLATEVTNREGARSVIHLSAEEGFALPAATYLHRANIAVKVAPNLDDLSAAYRKEQPGLYLWPDNRWLDANPYTPWKDQDPAISINGWYFDWHTGPWSLYKLSEYSSPSQDE